MKHTSLLFLAIAVMLCASPAMASVSYNEIINGDFNTGDLSFWQHGVDIAVAMDGPDNGYAATCKNPGGDLWLRQVVDDSLSPDWNWNLHQKLISATAQIAWSGWVPSNASVAFRLDWWSEAYNLVTDPATLPYYSGPLAAGSDPAQGYYVSDWVSFDLSHLPSMQWSTVVPFDQVLLPIQPRWVSLEVVYVQPTGVSVWLDNVTLTGKCVPEPSSLLALLGGCGVLLGGLRLRRK